MSDQTFSGLQGLTSADARERLDRDGPNELPGGERRSLLGSALVIVREPMSLLLLGCGAIYLVLGDLEEALMLLGFVFFILGITLLQERKTERALDALRDMASPRALVVRDGKRQRIPGRDVVAGDIVVLAEGDRVPADITVLEATHLSVDESLLTGESAPVRKGAWDGVLPVTRPGGEDLPFAFASTLVVGGSCLCRVHAVGSHTEIGRIGRALEQPPERETALERETHRLVVRLGWVAGGLSLLATVVYGLLRGSWLEALLAGLTLAMAILPNELPVVVAIFLALGAFRLSQRRVLTRRVPVIEAIGTATVLAVDKTGTLTENRMAVRVISSEGQSFEVERLLSEPLPEAFHEVVEYAILASRADPFDPMERAFKELGERYLAGTEHLHDDFTLLREYPLTRELLAVTQVHRDPSGKACIVAMKGAPESVADLCHLTEEHWVRVRADADKLAGRGLRVLAVASGRFSGDELPGHAHDFDFRFEGLVGLADPVRKAVPSAIAECHRAGIRVVMITGDYPATAAHIAREIGLPADSIMTGAEVAEASAESLAARVRTTCVFARVLPEQKYQIVHALRRGGEVVAMTGDGVNDAPALRAANIGVAMGGRGTDVAREAASLVLLDDDFTSLVQAVRSGRRILDNLRKALAYVLAVHLPVVGLTLVPLFMGWPLVLLAIHVAFLHLIIDPACSVVFEAEGEESDVMSRPPRDPAAPIFDARSIGVAVIQGVVLTAVVVGMFALALHQGRSDAEARALTFTTFMVGNVGLVFVNRSWSSSVFGSLAVKNHALFWVALGAVVFLGLVLYAPWLRGVFRFDPLSPRDLLLCLVAGVLGVFWFDLVKVRWRRAWSPSLAPPPCFSGRPSRHLPPGSD